MKTGPHLIGTGPQLELESLGSRDLVRLSLVDTMGRKSDNRAPAGGRTSSARCAIGPRPGHSGTDLDHAAGRSVKLRPVLFQRIGRKYNGNGTDAKGREPIGVSRIISREIDRESVGVGVRDSIAVSLKRGPEYGLMRVRVPAPAAISFHKGPERDRVNCTINTGQIAGDIVTPQRSGFNGPHLNQEPGPTDGILATARLAIPGRAGSDAIGKAPVTLERARIRARLPAAVGRGHRAQFCGPGTLDYQHGRDGTVERH